MLTQPELSQRSRPSHAQNLWIELDGPWPNISFVPLTPLVWQGGDGGLPCAPHAGFFRLFHPPQLPQCGALLALIQAVATEEPLTSAGEERGGEVPGSRL